MVKVSGLALPALSLVGLIFAVNYVAQAQRRDPIAPPVVQPPRNPYPQTISGAGIVEPAGEKTVAVGPTIPGVVQKVWATVSSAVTRGQPLLELDKRTLEAERSVRAASRDVAKAKLTRLELQPRPEEIPPLEARLAEAQATNEDFQAQLSRLEKAVQAGRGIVSLDELDQRRFRVVASRRGVERAQAELALAKAGAWAPDVAQARADLAQTEAALAQTDVELDRAVIRAPADAVVLQVNIREGEYAQANLPLVVLGEDSEKLVRVDVDEESAPLVRSGCRAKAMIRGFPDNPVELEFFRIEPYIRPKISLTGDNTERVDTRVLQVLFRLGKTKVPVYIGQQLDVFMESTSRESLVAGAVRAQENR